MSSSALIETKPITKNLSEFTPDKYATFHPGELVVFAIAVFQDEETAVMTEEIVSVCFRLFPHSFALKNYFYWPDSALVARRLSDAREKGFIKGNPADGFILKGKGKQLAKRIAKALGVSLPTPPKVETVNVEVQPAREISAPVGMETPEPKKIEAQLSLLPEMKETPKKKPVKIVKKKPTAKKKETKPVTQAPKKVKPAKTKIPGKPASAAPEKKGLVKKSAATPAPKKKTSKKAVISVQVKKAPVKKTLAPEKKVPAKKVTTPAPKKKTTKKVVTPTLIKKAPVKKSVTPAPKKKAPARKTSAPKVEKRAPVVKIEKKKKATPKLKSAKLAQLTLALPTSPAKKTAGGPATKPKVTKEAKTVRQEAAPVAQVTKEEKDKAGKFIKMVERSDAFLQYKRNGGKAKISEFDFRNMLVATMESSAETLKRNVDLFKRYAGIHNRADLITFLVFCEDSFAPLLVPQVKRTRNQK